MNIEKLNGNLLLYSICIFVIVIVAWLIVCRNLTQMFNRKYSYSGYQCANFREVTLCIVYVYHGYIYLIIIALFLIYGSCLSLIIMADLLSRIPSTLTNIYMGIGQIPKIPRIEGIQMLGGPGGIWFLAPWELYIKGARSWIYNTPEYHQFIHDKIVLHQLKQMNSSYKNIELMHIPNFDDYARFHYFIGSQGPEADLDQRFPNGILPQYYQLFLDTEDTDCSKWAGVPDAVFFNKGNNTMSTVQYKSKLSDNFNDFNDPRFFKKFNRTTHVMSILLKNPDKYADLIEIINTHRHNYDIGLRVSENKIDGNLFEQMNEMNREFMIEQGDTVLSTLYSDLYNKNYSKLQVDEHFLQDFYECMKFYDGQQNFTTLIQSTKSDI